MKTSRARRRAETRGVSSHHDQGRSPIAPLAAARQRRRRPHRASGPRRRGGGTGVPYLVRAREGEGSSGRTPSRTPIRSCALPARGGRRQGEGWPPAMPAFGAELPMPRQTLDAYSCPRLCENHSAGHLDASFDSNSTPNTHQRFVETVTSILLLRANNSFRRFPTAWPLCRRSY